MSAQNFCLGVCSVRHVLLILAVSLTIGTACPHKGLRNDTVSVRPSVLPLVCPIYPLQQREAGLLLWARRVSIDCCSSGSGQCHVVSVRR